MCLAKVESSGWNAGPVSRFQSFSDARLMVEGIIYRYRCGIAWRDLPESFGPWQTVWTWHHRMAVEGTRDKVLATLTAQADAEGLIDRSVAVGGLDNRSRASACDEHDPPHRGMGRTTRIQRSSRLITGSAARGVGCRRRSISSSMATGCLWSR